MFRTTQYWTEKLMGFALFTFSTEEETQKVIGRYPVICTHYNLAGYFKSLQS
jgi:hypothetical protein